MNEVMVAGNVGRDAILLTTKTGTKVCFFSVADDQWRSNKPIWWNCSLIGERAEKLFPFIKKGRGVSLVGTLRETESVDKETGEVKVVRDLAVSQIMFHGSNGSKVNEPTLSSENECANPKETDNPEERQQESKETQADDDLNAPDPEDTSAEVPHYARHGWEDLGEL